MSLIGKLVGTLVKRGRLTLISADGTRETYGPGGGGDLTLRFMDRSVPLTPCSLRLAPGLVVRVVQGRDLVRRDLVVLVAPVAHNLLPALLHHLLPFLHAEIQQAVFGLLP